MGPKTGEQQCAATGWGVSPIASDWGSGGEHQRSARAHEARMFVATQPDTYARRR